MAITSDIKKLSRGSVWWRWFYCANWSGLMQASKASTIHDIAIQIGWYKKNEEFVQTATIEVIVGSKAYTMLASVVLDLAHIYTEKDRNLLALAVKLSESRTEKALQSA